MFLLGLIAVPLVAFAGEEAVKASLLPPETLMSIILALQSVPYIGPIVIWLLKAVAVVTPVMTALTICATTVLRVPQIIARFSGAHDLADSIEFWADRILYWLKMFSIFNANSKKPN